MEAAVGSEEGFDGLSFGGGEIGGGEDDVEGDGDAGGGRDGGCEDAVFIVVFVDEEENLVARGGGEVQGRHGGEWCVGVDSMFVLGRNNGLRKTVARRQLYSRDREAFVGDKKKYLEGTIPELYGGFVRE